MTTARQTSIIATRDRNPCATLQEIGDKYGITRERVRQVLKEAGVQTKHVLRVNHLICPFCGGEKTYNSSRCPTCREAQREAVRLVPLVCDQCGTMFERKQVDVLTRAKRYGFGGPVFCSRRCQGIYTAEHYGIGTPNNPIYKTVFPNRVPKWDYGELYRLRDLTGWGAIRLSRALGIPEGTVSDALRRRQDATETPPNEL